MYYIALDYFVLYYIVLYCVELYCVCTLLGLQRAVHTIETRLSDQGDCIALVNLLLRLKAVSRLPSGIYTKQIALDNY